METMRFSGKVAVITGAAGGIGRATVARFLAEGASVYAIDRQPVASPSDERLIPIVLDLADRAAIARTVESIAKTAPRIDFLINNAGIGGSKSIQETNREDWDRFLAINLTATYEMCRAFLPMMSKPGGRIVNIASVFGMTGFPGSLAYSVSKAGVAQLSRQMAADLAPEGILVNAIAPGIIETNMTRRRLDADAWYKVVMCEATPIGRNGKPEDIAGPIAFLCSDDAAFVSGQVLVVDGGWLEAKYLPASGKVSI
jgi:NAD(P)-dependent dehydrogenase (short-subunit alcohol dehydrogenase family)